MNKRYTHDYDGDNYDDEYNDVYDDEDDDDDKYDNDSGDDDDGYDNDYSNSLIYDWVFSTTHFVDDRLHYTHNSRVQKVLNLKMCSNPCVYTYV